MRTVLAFLATFLIICVALLIVDVKFGNNDTVSASWCDKCMHDISKVTSRNVACYECAFCQNYVWEHSTKINILDHLRRDTNYQLYGKE